MADRLAPYERPSDVMPVESIPMTDSDTVLKTAPRSEIPAP